MKIVSKVVCVLPDCLKKIIGSFLGKVFWFVTPTWRKKLAYDQVQQCLQVDEAKARKIAQDSVLKYGHMIVEVLCFPLLNKDNIDKKVVFQDKAKLQKLLEQGRGIVWATAHFGNWELFGAGIVLHGFKLAAVAQKQNNEAMDRFINEYRTMVGEHVTYKTGVIEMTRMLEHNYLLGLLADQDAGSVGVMLDFFGKSTSCPKGPAALARLKKSPLVLALMQEGENGIHEIVISEPVEVEYSKNREQDILNATKKLMFLLEQEIRKNPTMWFWLHNRWKADKKIYE